MGKHFYGRGFSFLKKCFSPSLPPNWVNGVVTDWLNEFHAGVAEGTYTFTSDGVVTSIRNLAPKGWTSTAVSATIPLFVLYYYFVA